MSQKGYIEMLEKLSFITALDYFEMSLGFGRSLAKENDALLGSILPWALILGGYTSTSFCRGRGCFDAIS